MSENAEIALYLLGFLTVASLAIGISKSETKTASLSEIIAKKLSPFPLKCKIIKFIKFYDGDSVYVAIDNIFFMFVFAGKIGLRLNRIDTAEMNGKSPAECKLAIWQKELCEKLWLSADAIEVTLIKPDKYWGRVIAEVILITNGRRVNYSDYMLKHGKAKPYDGGTKSEW